MCKDAEERPRHSNQFPSSLRFVCIYGKGDDILRSTRVMGRIKARNCRGRRFQKSDMLDAKIKLMDERSNLYSL